MLKHDYMLENFKLGPQQWQYGVCLSCGGAALLICFSTLNIYIFLQSQETKQEQFCDEVPFLRVYTKLN